MPRSHGVAGQSREPGLRPGTATPSLEIGFVGCACGWARCCASLEEARAAAETHEALHRCRVAPKARLII